MFSGIHPGTASRRLVCNIIPLLTILTEILRLRLRMTVAGGNRTADSCPPPLSHYLTVPLSHYLTSQLAH